MLPVRLGPLPAALLSTLLLTVACGGDGAPDDPIDAGPAILVGSWRAAPHPLDQPTTPVDQRPRLTFAGDGSLEYWRPSGLRTFDWTTDGERLTLTRRGAGSPRVQTFPYRLVDGVYLDNVTSPVGPVDGFVGVWEMPKVHDGVALIERYTLRADHGGSAELVGANQETYDVQWREQGDFLQVAILDLGLVVDIQYYQRYGDVIGVPYEALPPTP